MNHRLSTLALGIALACGGLLAACGGGDGDDDDDTRAFQRVASFAVCSQTGSSCEDDETTAAEIVAASSDGMTLVYTNSPKGEIGFVDITDPAAPAAAGRLDMDGEPTSVAVTGDYALVAVNTSESYTEPSGRLVVVEMATRRIVATLDLPGQPDAVAVGKDGRYAAIAIENERDEDVDDGEIPQLPGGSLTIVDLVGAPSAWGLRSVDLTGLAAIAPEDPEPEYVDINEDNVAVVSLQENNHVVLVDLESGEVQSHFSAGTVDLAQVDTEETEPARIELTGTLDDVKREPDGVAWIGSELFATADEGDLDGGSRGFTLFRADGSVAYEAGSTLEHEAVRLGHYPEGRSDAKGNEPENVRFARFGDKDMLFVASERSSLVFVYDVDDPTEPKLMQTLPAGVGPEGVYAIPARDLLIAASEEDARGDVIRSVVNIYRLEDGEPAYPTVRSADRADGTPIPWGALSGLAADPEDDTRVHAIDDSFYAANRIFTIELGDRPALIDRELPITDADGVLAGLAVADVSGDARNDVFDAEDLAAMINRDGTVNLDPEGIAVASDGGFWIASEGAGTVGDEDQPVTSENLVLKLGASGVIERVIRLPEALNAVQLRFGFEGIAEWDGKVVVAFQRAWNGESAVRLGLYDLVEERWSFVYYTLDAVASPNGGWVGLSELTALGDGRFMVVERDNQGGPDARVKRLYEIDLAGAADGATVTKRLVRDLMDDLVATGGPVPEKIEGATRLPDGRVLIVNDNDGVNDSNGATFLLDLGALGE